MTFFLQDYTFCLLIVRYMLSDKIKGKSALKARTFLHVVCDKVHACYWYRLSMHLSTEKQCRLPAACSNIFLKPFIGEIFTYKKHPIHRNSSAMVINMDFLCQYIVTDIKQTCLGQGLGVTISARKRTSKVKNLGHTSDLYIYRSLIIRCLVVKIEHLQVTVDVTLKNHANLSVKQLSKFTK